MAVSASGTTHWTEVVAHLEQNPGEGANWAALPANSLGVVASHMTDEEGIRGLAYLAKTCRAFRAIIRTDKLFIKGLMERNWQALILANLTLKEDPELIRCAMRGAGAYARYDDISDLFTLEHFAQDKEVVLGAIGKPLTSFFTVKERFRDDLEVVSVAVSSYAPCLEYASERLRDNDDVVRIAVAKGGLALKFASERLQDDPEIVGEAVRQNGLALKYASERLQADPEIVREAVRQNGLALQYASEGLQDDPDIVREAVRQNGLALEHASERLQDDPDIVGEAVRQNGLALKHASEKLQADPEVVLLAIRQDSFALEFACPELKKNKEIVRAAVLRFSLSFKFADPELRKDRAFLMALMQESDGFWEQYIDPALFEDKEFVMVLVEKTSSFRFTQLSEELQMDPDIAFAALDHYDGYIHHISPAILADSSFVLGAAKRYGWWVASNASMDLRNDRGFIRELAAVAPKAFFYAGDDLHEDTEFVIENIEQNGVGLRDLPWRALKNRAIVIAAVQQDPGSLQYAAPELQSDPEILAAASAEREE